jgi:PAS domain S-box-containing protein
MTVSTHDGELDASAAEVMRLRAVLRAIPDLIWLKDPQGVYLACNPAFARLYGLDEADVAGKTDDALAGSGPAAIARQREQAVLASGAPRTDEEWLTSQDGRRALHEVIRTPMPDARGEAAGVLAIARDITAARRSREALQAQLDLQQRLEQMADTAPGGLCSFLLRPDGSTCLPYVSPAWEHIHGLRASDVRADATPLFRLIHPDDVEHVNRTIAESARAMRPWRDEYRILNPVRGLIHVEGHSMPVREPDGGIMWHGFITDITERKHAEETIRLKDELLRLTGALAKVGGWEFDPQTGAGTWTDEVARIHGLDPSQQTSEALGISFYAGESRQRIELAIEEAVRLARPYDLELEMTAATGERKWVRTIGTPVVRDGRVVRMQGIFQDITERKRAEQALRESEDKFRSITEQLTDVIFVTDPRGFITYISPAAQRVFGYGAAEMTDHHFTEFLDRGDIEKALASFIASVFSGETVKQILLRMRRKDESLFDGELDASPFRSRDAIGTLGVIRDVTERRQAEERLRATLEEKETLLREVHHRVKNNLQAMIALIEMRSRHLADEGIRLFLRELEGQARTMSLVYEQLYQAEQLSRVDMAAYLRQLAINVMEAFGGQRDIRLHLDAAAWLDVAQAMPCGLIVNELLTNALKHAFPPGFSGQPAIDITLRQDGRQRRLTVRDNGVGFPPGQDWRAGNTLGLRLVHLWATHQLGGTLDVDGQPGAAFTIAFDGMA